jgi:fatty acid desaturase
MNRVAASSISLLGANHFMWNMKHNMIHHSFTNVDGVDDDIEVSYWKVSVGSDLIQHQKVLPSLET